MLSMSFRQGGASLTAFALILLTFFAAKSDGSAMADEQKTVRAVMHAALRVTDPLATTAYITRNYGYMIYDTLLGTDENFKIQPQMASWSVSGDKRTYTFQLREGLTWHDGSPVTAEDCIASIKRWAERDTLGQRLMEETKSLEAIDDGTFQLTLKRPLGFVLQAFAKLSPYPLFMMPKRIAEVPFGTPITDYTGSGPFRFMADEFKPGVKAVFEKNENYVPRDEPPSWTAGGKHVKVDRVEWIVMPDAKMQVNALRAGEIDMVEHTPFDLLPLIEADARIMIRAIDPFGSQIMGRMNFLHPPFDDAEVRRAALLALNQKDFLQALVGNPAYYRECAAMFICGTPLETDIGGQTLLNDTMEEARAALAASDYDGAPVVILQPTDVGVVKTHPIVAAQLLSDAGFTVDAQPMDWQAVVSRRASQNPPEEGGWNMFFTIWNATDLLNPLVNHALNGRGTSGAWFGWPDDPKLEEYRMAYAAAVNDDARKAIAKDMQKYAYDQVIALPLGQFLPQTAWRRSLSGVQDSPIPLFWGLSKN